MRIFGVTLIALAMLTSPAFARGHGGYHSGSSRHGSVYGFRTSQCKSASCFRKHPGGTYVHPLTHRKHG
jgi:hypothetical protein